MHVATSTDKLSETLQEMDFEFLGNGDHSMSVEGMRKVINNDHFLFLDVRTDNEKGYLSVPFTTHIPLHELPERVNELPSDKCIIAFCSSIFRGAVAYTFLRSNGFEEVKCLTASMEEMIGAFKPWTSCENDGVKGTDSMNSSLLAISGMSFVMSFIFALGGVGSAVVLIPTLTWMGIPFAQARSIGLFVNGVSMMGATWSNIREKRLDYQLGLPIIIASIVLAPVGAWIGLHAPTRYVMYAFTAFLVFSGLMILFFNGSKFKDIYREDRPITGPLFTGVGSGFLSGLLGVGGGGLISPLMILQGFNPKKVATVTAFAVPFSSFTAFLAYATMGSVHWQTLFCAGVAAWAGGYLGTIVMQKKMRPTAVRKFLGVILILLALRMIQKMMV